MNMTPTMDCTFGAPMGRWEKKGEPTEGTRFYLRRIRLDNGGYDSGGAYWGVGAPLYGYESQDGEVYGYLRAEDREAAKWKVERKYAGARFFK